MPYVMVRHPCCKYKFMHSSYMHYYNGKQLRWDFSSNKCVKICLVANTKYVLEAAVLFFLDKQSWVSNDSTEASPPSCFCCSTSNLILWSCCCCKLSLRYRWRPFLFSPFSFESVCLCLALLPFLSRVKYFPFHILIAFFSCTKKRKMKIKCAVERRSENSFQPKKRRFWQFSSKQHFSSPMIYFGFSRIFALQKSDRSLK